jgi:hypothetical protein
MKTFYIQYIICVCVCVRERERERERECISMYVCMCVYTYVHTCYVLTNPPIPSSRCKCFVFLRPVYILLHKRTNTRPPPCNVLKNVLFIFFKAITLFFCVLFKFYFVREGTQGPHLVNPLNNVFFLYL